MPRTQEVQIADKKVTVTEKRVKELEALFEQVKNAFININKDADDFVGELKNAAMTALYKLPELIAPDLTQDDIQNAYMSEIESLVEAFINVNFTGVKKAFGQFSGLLNQGLNNLKQS